MKRNLYLLAIIYFTVINTVNAQIPTQNLKLWLRADSGVVHNNGAVDIWQDVSGNGNHAVQNTQSLKPNYINNALNNKPAIYFNNSYLDINFPLNFNSIIILANYDNPVFLNYAGLITDASSNYLYIGNVNDTNFYPSIITSNTYINGVIKNSFHPLINFKILSGISTTKISWNNLRVGIDRNMNDRIWVGNVLEVLIYDTILTNTERINIENILMNKYAPPIKISQKTEVINGICNTKLKVPSGYSNIIWSTNETTDSIIAKPNNTYIVTGVDIFGRISHDTLTVGFKEINIPESLFCPGDSLNLGINLIGNYTYNWSTSSTNSNIFVSQAGTYWVEAIDTLSCALKYYFEVNIDSLAYKLDLGPDISVCSGEEISLISGDLNITSYLWSTTATTPTIQVLNSGTYSLTVTNSNLCVANDSIIVNIHGYKPNIGFTAANLCLGETTLFTDTSTAILPDGINTRKWIIQADTFYIPNPQYQFSNHGNYNVNLTVVTDSGCVASLNKQIKINELPQADFSLPDFAWTNDNVSIVNNSSSADNITNTNWTVFDSNNNTVFSSNIYNPSFVFINAGIYSIQLEIETDKDCKNLITKNINIEERPIPFNNLSLWLRADRGVVHNQNSVSIWKDQSNKNNNATQTTPSFQPLYKENAIGGKPALLFDGLNDYMLSQINITDSNLTTFLILKNLPSVTFAGSLSLFNSSNIHDHNNSNSIIIALFNGSNITALRNGNSFNYQPENNTFNLFRLEANGSVIKTKTNNGSVLIGSSVGIFNSNKAVIGSRYSSSNYNYFMNMEVAEIIIYDSLLTSTEMSAVENYLMNKYSPAVSLGPDINIDYGFCSIELKVGDNFNNIVWSTGSTTPAINVNQSGTYWVSAIDIFGRFSTDTINIQFPNFNINNETICFGDNIIINPGLSGSYTYLWSTTETTPTININTQGNYWLEIKDSLNCINYKAFTVIVDSFPLSASLGPDKSICQGDEIELISGHQSSNIYLWSDASTSPTLMPLTSGQYNLTVTNSNNCLAIDSINISFHGYKPNLSYSIDTVCLGSATNFISNSTATAPDIISNTYWLINGDTLSGNNANYIYSQSGNQNFQLNVTTQAGCFASVSGSTFVIPNPEADFNPLNACTNKDIKFSNISTLSFGNISSWEWTKFDLNNQVSAISNLTHPTFSFDSSGIYDLRLIATSNFNCKDTIIKQINVRKTPVVDFSYGISCVGLPVNFREETQLEPWESIIERKWWLGDGNTSQFINPVNTYLTPDYYNVSLYNKSINGCVDTITKQIKVSRIPITDFIYSDACVNSEIQFTDQSHISNDTINKWLWTFNNNLLSTERNPKLHFPVVGSYNIQLEVTTVNMCKSKKASNFTVNPAPTSNFVLYPEYGTAPLEVTFTNQSSSANAYIWDFGDGNSSQINNPVHTFMNTNIFETRLIAINNYLCKDTTIKMVYVIPSTYDVSIKNIQLTETNGLTRIFAEVQNLGTRRIRSLKFQLKIDNNVPIYEIWDGVLNAGENMIYSFGFAIDNKFQEKSELLCIKVEPNEDVVDEDESNNTYCHVFNNKFKIHNISPNPAKDIVNIVYQLTEESVVSIEILSSEGRILLQHQNINGQQGINNISLNISNLEQGIYILNISNKNEKIIKKLVIN